MDKKILIGLSWPYANGRLHIGHIASSLPGDVLARFHRMNGDDVAFVTGSDCYGTPILVAARAEGITPLQLSDKYHAFHDADFKSLGFTFSNYTKTTSEYHNKFAQQFHAEMYGGQSDAGPNNTGMNDGLIFPKEAMQLYCKSCVKYLPDRYVEGICPHCKNPAKGDSCDHCGRVLEPEELVDPKCKLCGATPVPKMTRQLYLRLSALQSKIEANYNAKKDSWGVNAIGLAGRYLKEGLHDRAITRNIEWGVPLPKSEAKAVFNFTDDELAEKKIYIWAENVLGYFSAAREWAERSASAGGMARRWEDFLLSSPDVHHYYVHAKDNIPFHSLILPGLLLANKKHDYKLPDQIVSSEYVNIANDKISKSKGNLITVEAAVQKFDVDAIRWFFLRNVSDRKDVNFTYEEFVNTVNAELVNGWGNLVNRTLSFVKSKMDGVVKLPKINLDFGQSAYKQIANDITDGKVARGLHKCIELINAANRHFDDGMPWKTIKDNPEKCNQTIFDVVTMIANLAKLLAPFVPNSAKRVASWLNVDLGTMERVDDQPINIWKPHQFTTDINIGEIEVLFKRLDIKEITKE
ncbi:MAG: methionine--tRNA ligase [Firmicutes bacterium]|nr:methionine--tRNA ligase [Bacillota bacterium]